MATVIADARRRAEARAAETLELLDIQTIPVNPITIAKALGIEVRDVEFAESNISGMISMKEKKATIYVKHNDNIARKRFTIAHEIGHYVMHLKDAGSDGGFMDRKNSFFRTEFVADDSHSLKEVEANQFAAALLMPREQVEDLWSEYEFMWDAFDSLRGIADEFGVSEAAMRIRLQHLRLI